MASAEPQFASTPDGEFRVFAKNPRARCRARSRCTGRGATMCLPAGPGWTSPATPLVWHIHGQPGGPDVLVISLRSADGVVMDGDWLRHGGLPLPRSLAETAFIVHLHKL